MRACREVAHPSLALEGFEGQDCHLGLDLASRTDAAALAVVLPMRDPDTGKARYTAFARCYLNEAAVLEARNPSYPGWAAKGHLAITPGNEADFDRVEGDVLELCRRFRVASVGFDPWQSTQMAQRLHAEGVPMFDFRTTTQNLSPAINERDAAMRSGRLRHDGDPVLGWCVGDVVGRPDRRGNLYPTKQRPEQKIDAAVALMKAVGRAMAEDANEGDLENFLRYPVIA